MTIIHAYRRTAPHPVELFGQVFKFEANEAGHQVCNVPDGPAAKRLLEITEGYKAYGVDATQPDDEPEAPSEYLMTTEGEGGVEVTVDLRTLNIEQLREFAKENEIPFHPQIGDAKLRDKIVDFFKVAE